MFKIILEYSPEREGANPIKRNYALQPTTDSTSTSSRSDGARLISIELKIENNINTENKRM